MIESRFRRRRCTPWTSTPSLPTSPSRWWGRRYPPRRRRNPLHQADAFCEGRRAPAFERGLCGRNGAVRVGGRAYYNMSYEEAAQRIGVDVDKYKNWENGTDYPTYAKLRKISDAFHKPSGILRLKATEYSSRNSKGVSGSPRVRMFWAS